MTALIIIAVVVLLLALRAASLNSRKNEENIRVFKEAFGEFSTRVYGADEFSRIRRSPSFWHLREYEDEIDEITANDINLDELYKKINISCSQMGDEYLYRMLRRPVYSVDILRERSETAEIIRKNEGLRLELMQSLKNMGRMSGKGLTGVLEKLDSVRDENNVLHYICIIAALIAAVLIFARPVVGFVTVFLVLIFDVYTYFKRKGEINDELTAFAYIFNCLRQAKSLIKIKADGLEKYFKLISDTVDKFRKVTVNSFIMTAGRSLTGNILSLPLDYVRIIFHLDLIKFNNSLKTVRENRDGLFALMDTIGFLDASLSTASFREGLGEWCEPELYYRGDGRDSGEKIAITGLYHPLVENAVPYDIKTDKGILITGSNASGKSTFLRSAALMFLLGETIYTVPARRARIPLSRIYSSMAVNDSVTRGDSLYMAEIKAVKRILDALLDKDKNKNSIGTVCFLDEILRGTNTIERIAAGSQILKELSERGALVFAATHDTELTDILAGIYDNRHFSESIENESIHFTYELQVGAARTRNAIALLKLLDFDDKITGDAFAEAEEFERSGVWSKL